MSPETGLLHSHGIAEGGVGYSIELLCSVAPPKCLNCPFSCAGERFGDYNVNKSTLSASLVLAATLPFSTFSTAESEQIPDQIPEQIIVTANRMAQTADQTLAPVTVITRDDIEKRQARSLPELLQGEAGISVINNGGLGKNTSVFMRGTESGHLLVMVDGIKVGSATLGSTSFQHIPVDQIERIEIVRGPRSSLYGSEAIGGVIQIFTRKGSKGLTPSFSVGAGSHHTYNATASLSGGSDNSWFNGTLAGIDTQGFNACNGSSTQYAGCFTEEPDKDGYSEYSGSVRVGYRLDNGTEFELTALRAAGETEFDGSLQNEAEVVQQVIGGRVSLMPTDIWNIKLNVGRSEDQSKNFKEGVFVSRFDTARDMVSWQNDIAIGNDMAIVGVDFQRDSVDSASDYVVDSRNNTGLFGQYLKQLSGHDIELSARNDDNDQFGNHATGSIAWGYQLTPTVRLVSSYGTAFSAPTFNDLYFPEDAFSKANPDLQPEESKSVEVGVRFNPDYGQFELNLFKMDIDNLISWAQDPVSFKYMPSNLNAARILGLEATAKANLVGFDIITSLTLLDPESRSSDSTHGNELARRAKETLRVDIDRQMGPLGLGASLIAEGRRYDDIANTRELAGYGVLDVRGEFAFTKAWSVQARIENLFDRDYETAAFFNQPGRGYYLTLNYRPGAI